MASAAARVRATHQGDSSSPAVEADPLLVAEHHIRSLVIRVDCNEPVAVAAYRRHPVQVMLSREDVEGSGGERIGLNFWIRAAEQFRDPIEIRIPIAA